MADVLGYTLTNYWNNLTRDEEAYLRYFPNEWVISTRMNPDTEADYTSWDEYSESPYSYNKDHFTNVERYDLANTTFTEEAAAIEIDNVHGSQAAPYAAADIIILSDGLCSSACALFMELMRHEANVKTVVVGGRPDYTPMQAPSGTRGAASYDIERMDYDITAALSIGDSVAEQFPTEREHAFFIAGASVNLRDQILRNDNSKTPLQFKFERADCRIFYTPDTWYNFTNLWNYAAKAAWKNSTLCIEKSPDHPTQPSASSTIYEVEATESTFVTSDLLDDKGEFSASIHLDDPSNDISDSGKDIENLKDLGKRCKGNHNCGGRLQCISVPVWDSELKPTMQRQCVRSCGQTSNTNRNPCPFGFYCPENHVSQDSTKSNRPTRFRSGFCFPKKQQGCPNGEDTNTRSCLQDLDGADLHCFPHSNCYTKCHVVHYNNEYPHLSTLASKIRWCLISQLEFWQKNYAKEPLQYAGSQVYLNDQWEENPNPYFIAHHSSSYSTEYDFARSEGKVYGDDDWSSFFP
jgi:hypothetical protein